MVRQENLFLLSVYPPQYPYCSRHQGLRRKLSFTWPYLLTNWANQWSCVNICWITTKLSLQIQTLLHPLRREGGLLDTAGHQNKSFCLLCHYHPFTPGLGSKCVYWTSWFFKHFTGFKPKIVKVGCVLSCSSSRPIHYISRKKNLIHCYRSRSRVLAVDEEIAMVQCELWTLDTLWPPSH